jgi:hypothetical protein
LEAELKESIVRYLLGELAEDGMDAVEDRFFADDVAFEEMTIVEDEIIDSYLRDGLSKARRAAFEKVYLASPARRDRVRQAEALRRALQATSAAERPVAVGTWRSAPPGMMARLAASVRVLAPLTLLLLAILSAVCIWLTIRTSRLQRQVETADAARGALEARQSEILSQTAELRDENQRLQEQSRLMLSRSEQMRAEVDELRSLRLNTAIPDVSYELAANLVRNGGTLPSVDVPRTAKSVELKLDMEPTNLRRFLAEIQSQGSTIWKKDFVKKRGGASSRQVSVLVPARLLQSGDYVITLSGSTNSADLRPIAEYSFTVVRK